MKRLLLILLLSGCTTVPQYHTRPNTTPTEYYADRRACIYDVQKAMINSSTALQIIKEAEMINNCLAAKGYR